MHGMQARPLFVQVRGLSVLYVYHSRHHGNCCVLQHEVIKFAITKTRTSVSEEKNTICASNRFLCDARTSWWINSVSASHSYFPGNVKLCSDVLLYSIDSAARQSVKSDFVLSCERNWFIGICLIFVSSLTRYCIGALPCLILSLVALWRE